MAHAYSIPRKMQNSRLLQSTAPLYNKGENDELFRCNRLTLSWLLPVGNTFCTLIIAYLFNAVKRFYTLFLNFFMKSINFFIVFYCLA